MLDGKVTERSPRRCRAPSAFTGGFRAAVDGADYTEIAGFSADYIAFLDFGGPLVGQFR